MRPRTSALLGTAMLVAVLLSTSSGGSTVDTATLKNGPNYSTNSPGASAPDYGLRVTQDATATEYGLL